MSTIKVTVTIGSEEFTRIRELVASGEVSSVSGFVQQAVRQSLNDVAGWAGILAEALEGTGGPLTPEEIEWADDLLAGGGTPAGEVDVA